MKIEHPLLTNLGGLLGTALVRQWMGTLDYRLACYDASLDPSAEECRGWKIYIFWHEYLLFPLYLYGHCNVAMLLSRHSDADVLGRMAGHLGFGAVRGSTNRGGTAALRELIRVSREMHLTITPDGPRGPRRQLALGPIYLAARTGLPLVTMGFGYDRCRRLNSWDRFVIPRAGCRARQIFGPETYVPAGLDRDGLEHYRGRVESLLERLTGEAERWAESGTRRSGELAKEARPASLRSRRVDERISPDSATVAPSSQQSRSHHRAA